jgi:hypothetical protein
MSERDQQPHEPGGRAVESTGGASATGAAPTGEMPAREAPEGAIWREQTTPGLTPIRGGAAAEPGYGSAGYGGGYGGGGYGGGPGQPGSGWGSPGDATEPRYSSRPVVFRRPDALAGLLLVLAGIAAGVSLLLHWVSGVQDTGWDIVHSGIDAGRSGVAEVFAQGYWEPMAVVAAGAVLFVLGLLLFVPARTHRFLGILALLVSLVAVAGVLTPMAQDGWRLSTYDVGMWFAVAVAALGLLGTLKALLTGPRLGTQPPQV